MTLPAVRACHSGYPDLAVVQFDAHADLRAEYMGEHDSHATVMRRVGEVVGRTASFSSAFAPAPGRSLLTAGLFPGSFKKISSAASARRRRAFAGRPVYVTVDIDVVDPGFAPGTGTPEPVDAGPRNSFSALWSLEGLNVVGFDVVEVNPLVDSRCRHIHPGGQDRPGGGDLCGGTGGEARSTWGGGDVWQVNRSRRAPIIVKRSFRNVYDYLGHDDGDERRLVSRRLFPLGPHVLSS